MTQSNPELGDRSDFLEELERIVMTRLAGHVSQVQLIDSADGLTLRGFCKSFHAKQMAQELLMQFGNFRVIANELAVGYADDRARAARFKMSDRSLNCSSG